MIAQGDGEGGGEASGCDADAAAGVFRENMLRVMCGYYMPVTVDKLAHRGVDRAGWAAAGGSGGNKRARRMPTISEGQGAGAKSGMMCDVWQRSQVGV